MSAKELLGVRLARSGPVLFVRSGDFDAAPGDRVIVMLPDSGEEREATVVIGTGQLLSAALSTPAGVVARRLP